MRMCSITPYFILNNICAVSNMSYKDYFIGNWGMLPCDIPVIYLGASVSDIAKLEDNKMSASNYILMAIGAIIIVVVISLVTYYANKEFKQAVAESEAERTKDIEMEGRSSEIPQVVPDTPEADAREVNFRAIDDDIPEKKPT